MRVSPDWKQLVVGYDKGSILLWSVDLPSFEEAWLDLGRCTNLRVCSDTLKVVPVTPFPLPESVWAPPSSCQ